MHPLIERAKKEGRNLLEPEVLILLKEYRIKVPMHRVVQNEEEALNGGKSLGWPIVMKVVSPDILHKTEFGGVILDIRNERQTKEAFFRLSLLKKKVPTVEGFIIYPFQKHDIELSVGMVRDPQFGPVITFGLGGVWIEIFRDLAYGIAPLSMKEAEEMINSIRAHSILEGLRKKPTADRGSLCRLLVSLSLMAVKEKEILETDLNPIFPMEKGYFIADGRIIV